MLVTEIQRFSCFPVIARAFRCRVGFHDFSKAHFDLCSLFCASSELFWTKLHWCNI